MRAPGVLRDRPSRQQLAVFAGYVIAAAVCVTVGVFYTDFLLSVFVAEREDGTLVGRLSVGRDPHPASTHVADVGLMVALDARRQGVGTALLRAAVDWARGAGIRKLELHVFPWNEAAIALYDAFGFEREGYRKHHYRRGGELVDAILMAYEVE